MSIRADSRFAPSQWETALLCNDVSHWLGASIASALVSIVYWVAPLCRADSRFGPSQWETALLCNDVSHWLGASPDYVWIRQYHHDMAWGFTQYLGCCFTNVWQAFQNNLMKILQCQKSHLWWEFQAETMCVCSKHSFGQTFKLQLEILIKSMISAMQKFEENILESLWNLSDTAPRVPIN